MRLEEMRPESLDGYTTQDILVKCKDEKDESIENTRKKRDVFKRRESLYLGIADQEQKVYVRYVFATIDTFMALEAFDERTVSFSGREFGSDEYADNINRVAEFDYEQMGCEEKKYFVRLSKYKYGVGYEIMDGWDDTLNCPTYKVMDAMVACPDWYGGMGNRRYYSFEMQVSRSELRQDDECNEEVIDRLLTTDQADSLLKQQQDAVYDNRELSRPIEISESDILQIDYHYTKFNNRRYLVVTGNDMSELIKIWEVPAITDVEKKDPSKIACPVIERCWRPHPVDPFHISIPDLLEDKQQMMQLFMNLNKIKAEHEALGDMFMFDPDKVDVSNLKVPSVGPKYIPVEGLGETRTPPMSEVPKSMVKSDAWTMPEVLKNEASMSIGMENRTFGVPGTGDITATENQRVQANQNLRIMLGMKWDNKAEKQFWLRWYKMYIYKFPDTAEKRFKLNNGLGSVYYNVKKKDFLGLTDIDIDIVSKFEKDAAKTKERIGFQIAAQTILADPNTQPGQRNFVLREMLKLNGVPSEKVDMMVKPTIEELRALSDLELLNRNEMPAKITNPDEDHRTYIAIYDRSLDTDAKFKAMQARRLAMQQFTPQAPTITPQQAAQVNQQLNAMNNMQMAQNMQQEGAVESLQTLGRVG